MELFPRKTYTDSQLIEGIKTGGTAEDRSLTFIYRRDFIIIKQYIFKNGGTEAEASDVFQDSIIVLYEKIKSKNFNLTASLSTFLFSIAKNKWLYKQRENRKFDKSESEWIEEGLNPWDQVLAKEKRGGLKKAMNQLGKDCQKILTFFYYERKNMKEISVEMGFKNEQIARNKRYKCTQYLTKIILKSTNLTKLFKETD